MFFYQKRIFKKITKIVEETADFVVRGFFVPFFPLWAGVTQVSIL